ncbi:MAG: 4Fe-4S binding protein [Spirochaetes bacterium]|nr:4Fe-4S binding protein [Spirochaetota bacterium]
MKKILVDLMKCRECADCRVILEEKDAKKNISIFNIIEKALFLTTCRKCEDAPCILVCPEDALEKNKDGLVQRNGNLCIGCKSCALACPFGTIPNYIVDYVIPKAEYCLISNSTDLKAIIKACPEKAIQETDEKPNAENHIYKLTDNVLIKDYKWEEIIK